MGFCVASSLSAQITTRADAVGNLLNKWGKDRSAAGLNGFVYENRDGGHSQFDAAQFPQLKTFQPTEADVLKKLNIGPAQQVRQGVLFGNCSMSAPADKGGSLPRIYLLSQPGYDFLTGQYLQNNVFFYPEHQDYDNGYQGHNGSGWGDLYPANVPYMVISQGSSFTDKPFIQAFLSAAAALPQDTQDGLVRNKLLAPILQSIFRRSNRMVQTDEDYFTGKAHPPVFDGSQIDEEKMVNIAHMMTASRVPPLTFIKVEKETSVTAGKDFFERAEVKSEVLGNSPSSVSRIFRGSAFTREMTVSAAQSLDVMRRPLTFKWVLLQGDPKRVKIEPSSDGSKANISVSWHPELRTSTGIPSHRVDIGVFTSNGFAWSAPAFITFYMLPNEVRYYDANGKLAEICYAAGNPDIGMPQQHDLRWLSLGRRLQSEKKSLGMKLLSRTLDESAQVRLASLATDLASEQERWRKISTNPEMKAAADQAQSALHQKVSQTLGTPVLQGGPTLMQMVEKAVSDLADIVDLYPSQQEAINRLVTESSKPTAQADLQAARQQVVDFQVLDKVGSKFALRYQPKDLIAGERYQMRQFNLTLLSQVIFPELLDRSTAPAFVDIRLSFPKGWRDLYRYTKDGKPVGWTRVANGRTYEFDLQGQLMPDGRTGRSVPVKYEVDRKGERVVFMSK